MKIDESFESGSDYSRTRTTKAVPFWVSIGLLLLIVGMLMFQTQRPQPRDVLIEVQAMRAELAERTKDRIYRSEFEAFLKANPKLKPPAGWEE